MTSSVLSLQVASWLCHVAELVWEGSYPRDLDGLLGMLATVADASAVSFLPSLWERTEVAALYCLQLRSFAFASAPASIRSEVSRADPFGLSLVAASSVDSALARHLPTVRVVQAQLLRPFLSRSFAERLRVKVAWLRFPVWDSPLPTLGGHMVMARTAIWGRRVPVICFGFPSASSSSGHGGRSD